MRCRGTESRTPTVRPPAVHSTAKLSPEYQFVLYRILQIVCYTKWMEGIKIFPLKIHEWLFLSAGFLMLVSLPWIDGVGFPFWVLAKFSYLTGIFFFILSIRQKNKKDRS